MIRYPVQIVKSVAIGFYRAILGGSASFREFFLMHLDRFCRGVRQWSGDGLAFRALHVLHSQVSTKWSWTWLRVIHAIQHFIPSFRSCCNCELWSEHVSWHMRFHVLAFPTARCVTEIMMGLSDTVSSVLTTSRYAAAPISCCILGNHLGHCCGLCA